jgi:hypothetical protein
MSGVFLCHDAEGLVSPSVRPTERHAEHQGHGTARSGLRMIDASTKVAARVPARLGVGGIAACCISISVCFLNTLKILGMHIKCPQPKRRAVTNRNRPFIRTLIFA